MCVCIMNSLVLCFTMQKEISKLKDDLEAEKRDLVRTLERASQEVENQSGKADSFIHSQNTL